MKCQVCQTDLPAGSTFCTNCGTPVPSNPYGSSPNQGIAPTMLASSTPPPDPYGAPPPANPYGTPTNPYGAPPTGYGASAPPPANPYGTPAAPYGAPAAPYGAPPAPGYNPVPGSYGQQPYIPQPPKKKGPNGCVIAIIIVAVLLVLGVSGIVGLGIYGAHKLNNVANNFEATTTAIDATSTADMGTANAILTPTTGSNSNTTPTTGTDAGVPTSSQIDPNAKANLTSAQTSHGVDSDDKPTDPTTSFTSGQTIDIAVTFSGKEGYAMVKIYLNGGFDTQSDSPLHVQSGYATGNFTFTPVHTGNFVAGLYWCQQSDCSDAALAQVVSFTVS